MIIRSIVLFFVSLIPKLPVIEGADALIQAAQYAGFVNHWFPLDTLGSCILVVLGCVISNGIISLIVSLL